MNGQKIDLLIILNHIITLNNLFGPKPTGTILMFYCQEEMWPWIAAYLNYLNILPQDELFVNIECDKYIMDFLGQL